MNIQHARRPAALAALVSLSLVGAPASTAAAPGAPGWRTDPDWYRGEAEWALYDASRVIYGRPRAYKATIFTNKQLMDRETTTKASGGPGPDGIEVFKHNVSEMVPTENYTYRFLTTSFVRTGTLEPYKLTVSTQEDCGSTFKRFVVDAGEVDARSFCYFPDAGDEQATYRRPGRPENFTFHDMLTLRLRGFPFEDGPGAEQRLKLVEDQTNPRRSALRPEEATVRYIGTERITVPYGSVETHHLRVEHARVGGTTVSEYWFAAEPDMRNVLVQHTGPWGVRYQLERLEWWAYWGEPRP